MYAGFHVAILNTIGFHELGLWDAATSKAPRGAVVHRGAAGLPTGVATEIWPMLPGYSVEEVRSAVKAHAHDLFTATITLMPLFRSERMVTPNT